MKKQMLLIVLLVGIMMLQGCCTIMSGNTQRVTVSSTPTGVKVRTDTGVTITTPGSIILSRKESHVLVAELPGYESQQKNIKKEWNGWLWADLLLDFGIISWPIDFGTGAAYKLTPGKIHFNLVEFYSCKCTKTFMTSNGEFTADDVYRVRLVGSKKAGYKYYVKLANGKRMIFGEESFNLNFELLEN